MPKKIKNKIISLFRLNDDFGQDNESARRVWVEKQLLSLSPGSSLLDVGAGECQYKPFCKHLRYTSQDFSQYDGKGNQLGLQTTVWNTDQIDVVCDILDFPQNQAGFDAILCTEVLEHVPNPVAVLEKMCSLLKPGGTLLLTAPFNSLTHFAPYHFCTGFSRYFYEHHMSRLNFNIVELSPNGSYPEVISQEIGRFIYLNNMKLDKWQKAIVKFVYLKFFIPILKLSYSNDPSAAKDLCCYGYHMRAQKNTL